MESQVIFTKIQNSQGIPHGKSKENMKIFYNILDISEDMGYNTSIGELSLKSSTNS